MERFYAPATRRIEPVAIREIADRIAGRDVVSLAAGWPAPDTLPAEGVARATERVLSDRPEQALQYGTTRGLSRLREQVATRLADRDGVDVGPENVLITAGAQQAVYLLTRAFVADGDTVAVGSPTYVAALSAFRTYRDTEILPVPVDREGFRVGALRERLNAGANPKLVYTVPAFQNPTGATTTRERRAALLDLAREEDFLVVEDQPYRDLRFAGESVPPYLALDPGMEHTLHLGTVSKTIAPGLRLGWVVGPEDVLDRLEVIKQPADLQTNVLAQHVTSEFVATEDFDAQVANVRETYREKRDVACSALTATMPEGVTWTEPDGGMFLWVDLPTGVDATAMLEDALETGVAYVPGAAFYPEAPEENTLRLCYSYVDHDDLRAGIETLGEVVRDHVEG